MNNLSRCLLRTALSILVLISNIAKADQYLADDMIIKGSLCVGLDCANGENFNYDTIRLKENNVRIRFIDSSSSSSFPTVDWEITANESTNGGLNKFSILNVDQSTIPFTIISGARENSIFVSANSRIGFGTTTPGVDLDIKGSNSPTIRLQQDTAAGFSAQSWDMGGNETNFFIRDVTNSGTLPFRIQSGATNGAIYIASDGDIGFETVTPDGMLDIAHPTNANNHAVLLSPIANFGINIDNGFLPAALFEVQTTGGKSRFAVKSDGNVGIGTATPVGRFEIRNLANSATYFDVDASGNVGIGTNTPSELFDIKVGASSIFNISSLGKTRFTGSFFDGDVTSCGGANGTFSLACGRFTPLTQIEDTGASSAGRMMFLLKRTGPSWYGMEDTTQNKLWYFTNAADGLNMVLYDKTTQEITVPLILTNAGALTTTGAINGGSSRNWKENIKPIDNQYILDELDKLQISSWNYKKEEPSISHIGPMAQDFYSLFNVGNDDEHINILDASGVSMAAIQALHQKVKELEKEVAKLRNQP